MEKQEQYQVAKQENGVTFLEVTSLVAYRKFIIHVTGACAALYELTTGKPAPKFSDILRG